jgi:hypothetical protein
MAKDSVQLLVNYSESADRLARQGRIRFDRVKLPDDWPDLIARVRRDWPVHVHFALRVGRGVTARDLDAIAATLRTSDTPLVSAHLSPHAEDFDGLDLVDISPSACRQVAEAMIRDGEQLVERFGAENIILENLPWADSPHYRVPAAAIRPETIRTVLDSLGTGLLLDLAHATIAARFFDMDEKTYLDALPLGRLRELHLSGVQWVEGCWQDHYPMQPGDWALLDGLLEEVRAGALPVPWALTFEYGGVGEPFRHRRDPEVLAEQLPRIAQRAARLQ